MSHKAGFKNVFARKNWQGSFGWTDPNCMCPASPVPANSLTKYRTLSWNYSMTKFVPPGPSYSATMQGSTTVDRYTGNTSQNKKFTSGDGSGAPTDLSTVFDLVGLTYCNGWTGTAGQLSSFIANDLNNGQFDGSTNTSGRDLTINSLSGTVISVTSTYPAFLAPSTGTETMTLTYSDDYTSDDVNADCNGLLAQWDMSNDAVYPWRTDTFCTFGPLVFYDEILAAPFAYNSTYPDASGVTYTNTIGTATGAIIGQPTPAGYDAYWDAQFPNCATVGPPNILEWGAYSPYWCPQATKWIDATIAPTLYAGAFASYAHGILYKSKWAEIILLTAPSYNFGRPWGYRDSKLHDQSTVNCHNIGGGGDCNTPYINQYGDLLFPSCPGIDGRNIIAAATNASPIQITLTRPAGLRTGDQVDISGCTGNTAANGSAWTITVIDAFNFTIDGSTGNGTYDAGSGYAVSTGAPSYAWDDNQPKGDWCLMTWTWDQRTSPSGPTSTTQSQQCSKFVPCCPAVVYITPQDGSQPVGETNGSSNSQSFPHPNLALDECYGSLWQSIPKQWMTDPLWQRPVIPCDLLNGPDCAPPGSWNEDDGSGLMDDPISQHYYFPQRTWYECRVTVPAGAPALPAPFTLTNNINDVGTTPPGQGVGAYVAWWVIAANRAETVAINGRFACEYADPMAVCADDSDVSPL